jgi:vesicle-fusing ATPase
LLIIATTSNPAMLSELEITELFDTELRVAPITSLRSLEFVLKEVQLFPTSEERRVIMQDIEQAFRPRGQDQYDTGETTLSIGVKKLLSLTEMARQDPAGAGNSLIVSLKEQAAGYNGPPPQVRQRIKAEETSGPMSY